MREIEHKFLARLLPSGMSDEQIAEVMHVEQGYLVVARRFEWRLRRAQYYRPWGRGESFTMALKFGIGFVRQEFEWEIPQKLYRFLGEFVPQWLTKRRTTANGWEIDVFEGVLSGLVLAEFEYRAGHNGESVPNPAPIGISLIREVTLGAKFANKFLSRLSVGDAKALVAGVRYE